MIVPPSMPWSPTPTSSSTSHSSSWVRGRTALGSTWPEPATYSRRRWRPTDPGGSSTPHPSPPTDTTPTIPSPSPKTYRRGAHPSTITPSRNRPAKPSWPKPRRTPISRSSSFGPASSPGRRPLRSPKRCPGTDFPTRCGKCHGQCLHSSRPFRIRARRCNSFTTTTWPPRSRWPQRLPHLLVRTTSQPTACCRCQMSAPHSAPGRCRCRVSWYRQLLE